MTDAPDGRTILVVEDEAPVRFVLTEILEAEGYVVLAAANGEEGLAQFRDHDETDLVITDVVMPGMSGTELAGAIRQARPGTRVIYLSGYSGDHAALHAQAGEGVRYVQKPFEIDDLLAVVREMLGETA